MKKLSALLLVFVMVLTLAVGMTACGSSENENSDSGNGNSAVASGEASKGSTTSKTTTFTVKGVTFEIPGDFEIKAEKDETVAIGNGKFVVSVNHNSDCSYSSQEEMTKKKANSLQKTYPESTVEVLKNESTGIYYYTITGSEHDHVTCEYIVGDASVSFITSNMTEEACETITSIKFAQ